MNNTQCCKKRKKKKKISEKKEAEGERLLFLKLWDFAVLLWETLSTIGEDLEQYWLFPNKTDLPIFLWELWGDSCSRSQNLLITTTVQRVSGINRFPKSNPQFYKKRFMQQSSKQIREQSEEQNESKGEFCSLPKNPEGHQGVSFVAEDQTCIALNK